MSGGPRHHLDWMRSIVNKNFQSKHVMMGTTSELNTLLALLNRKTAWQGDRIAYKLELRTSQTPDNVGALILKNGKIVRDVTPLVRERKTVVRCHMSLGCGCVSVGVSE